MNRDEVASQQLGGAVQRRTKDARDLVFAVASFHAAHTGVGHAEVGLRLQYFKQCTQVVRVQRVVVVKKGQVLAHCSIKPRVRRLRS